MSQFFTKDSVPNTDITQLSVVELLAYQHLIEIHPNQSKKCLKCTHDEFGPRTSVTAIEHHIKQCHSDEFRIYTALKSNLVSVKKRQRPDGDMDDDLSEEPNAKHRLTEKEYLLRQNEDNWKSLDTPSLMAIVFAKNSLPHHLIDDPMFKEFLCRFSESDSICRKSLKSNILQQAHSMQTKLAEILKNKNITVAFDGRKNCKAAKVTIMTVVCDGISYYWTSINNHYDRSTAAWLHTRVKLEIEKLISLGARVTSIASDNENTMNSLCNLLIIDFPFLIRIPCAAHMIQLCVDRTLSKDNLKKIIDESIDLIHKLSHVSNVSKLRSLQQSLPDSKPLALVIPNDTRWNSTFRALYRLCELKNLIQLVIPMSDIYWKSVEDICLYLKPFQKATDTLQRDGATLNQVYDQMQQLYTHAQMFNSLSETKQIQESSAVQAIQTEWNKHVNRKAVEAASILTFGDQSIDGQEFIVDWGTKFILHYKLESNNDTEEIIREKLDLQLGMFVAKIGAFSQIDLLVSNRIKFAALEKINFDARAIWGSYKLKCNELSLVAIALLSINPTSASVERAHSCQSDLHSPSRNRLTDEVVHSETFIRFNYNVIAGIIDHIVEESIEL